MSVVAADADPSTRPAGPPLERVALSSYGSPSWPAYIAHTYGRRYDRSACRTLLTTRMLLSLMRFSLWLYALASVATAASVSAALDTRASTSCTLKASGSDDAPAFLAAAFDASCPIVTVPSGTTLSIQSKLNMTGLSNKHIVCVTSSHSSHMSPAHLF